MRIPKENYIICKTNNILYNSSEKANIFYTISFKVYKKTIQLIKKIGGITVILHHSRAPFSVKITNTYKYKNINNFS